MKIKSFCIGLLIGSILSISIVAVAELNNIDIGDSRLEKSCQMTIIENGISQACALQSIAFYLKEINKNLEKISNNEKI